MAAKWMEGTKQERRMDRGKKENTRETNDKVNSKVGLMKKKPRNVEMEDRKRNNNKRE